MELKILALIDQKVEAVIEMDDIIMSINAKSMHYRWAFIKKILDEIKISALTDQQRKAIKTYLQAELKKLD